MAEGKQQSKASKLYAEATTELRETYRAEFDKLLAEKYRQNGMTYTKRKTAEERAEEKRKAELEKARQQVAALHEKYPELYEPAQDEPPVDIRSDDSATGTDDRA